MGLTREQILAAPDLASEEVEVPEWGGAVRVRELSAADLFGFWESCRNDKGELQRGRIQPALLARTVVDAEDRPLFDDAEIPALMAKSAKAVARVFEVAQRINGMGDAAEDAVKNSGAATSGASPSVSASPSA